MPPMPKARSKASSRPLQVQARPRREEAQGTPLRQRPNHPQCLAAQEILADRYDVSADVWSATNYKQLRTDALACSRWNRLHPTDAPRKSYLESLLEKEKASSSQSVTS